MDLKDPFKHLTALRVRIGAQEHTTSFDSELAPLAEIEVQLETGGIEVKREEIQTVGPFLTYKGEILAILYIFNSTSPSKDLLGNNAGMRGTPKFHFTWCSTLDRMTSINRFNRYVLSRSKKNLFRVEALDRDDHLIQKIGDERHTLEDIRLYPCQNCLNKLEYHGFSYSVMSKEERKDAVENFSIQEYLDENDGNLAVMKFIPIHTPDTVPKGGYTSDFLKISRQMRKEENWTCSECAVDMSNKKRGLHVHHKNGVKSDNRKQNLKVLCALCHREVDALHKTMHVSKDIETFIIERRNRLPI